MAPKRPLSPGREDQAGVNTGRTEIYASDPIEDRSSIFVAHYSPLVSAKSLQGCADFKSASHRVAAWRSQSKQRVLLANSPLPFQTGFDDDGEKYAGRRLAKVLEEMNVEGAIVVARWYGGILLGPVRFTHIENCAKQAIRQYLAERLHAKGPQVEPDNTKKRKVDEDDKERERLVQELPKRDESISTLRQLLAEMKGDSASSTAEGTQKTPSKPTNYASLSLESLRRLDKARDATITFLLRSIDEAEKASNVSQHQDKTSSAKEDPRSG